MPASARTGSRALLFTAFGLLLAVLTVLIVLGIARIESFNSQIQELTAAQSRKIGFVSELFITNGQRSAAIDRLFTAEGQPQRRAALERYQGAVLAYGNAVRKIQGLPATGAEQEARDAAMETGMKRGLIDSFDRLEEFLKANA